MEPTPESKGNERNRTEDLEALFQGGPDETKLALLKDHARLVRLLLHEFMEEEVEEKAGSRYQRQGDGRAYHRWGKNPGSVKVGDRRVKLAVPRLRKGAGGEGEQRYQSPEVYQRMRRLEAPDERLLKLIAHGLSTRDYEKVLEGMQEEVFGMSKSSVIRQF